VLSDVDTRSCWQLAEQAGDASPQAMQRLWGEAVWDADAVRDDVRGYVIEAIGDPGGVLILDDTGDLKRGVHSVGVQRQYTGDRRTDQECAGSTGQPGLIPLTANEIRRLFAKLITHITRPRSFHLAWSRWRRIHHARARTSHYRRRGDTDHQPATTPPRL
jgi:hypothetical protein